MKKSNRLLALLAAALMLTAALTSCGSKPAAASSSSKASSASAAASAAPSAASSSKAASSAAPSSSKASSAASSSKAAGDFDYIKGKGSIIIGITDFEPMNYKDANGKWTGFDTEFAEAVCKKLGIEPKFQEIEWDNKILELNAKSVDCLWNGMTLTNEVTSSMSCTKAYIKNAQVVVMKADKLAKYADAASMKGLKFTAEAGSAGEDAIKDAGLDAKYTAVSAQSDALLEVESGSSDACVVDITMAKAMTGSGASYSDLASGLSLTTEEYGIGFRKGSDMTEKVNAVMDELTKDGTMAKLADKYKLTAALASNQK